MILKRLRKSIEPFGKRFSFSTLLYDVLGPLYFDTNLENEFLRATLWIIDLFARDLKFVTYTEVSKYMPAANCAIVANIRQWNM